MKDRSERSYHGSTSRSLKLDVKLTSALELDVDPLLFSSKKTTIKKQKTNKQTKKKKKKKKENKKKERSLVSARVDVDPPASIYFIFYNFPRSRNITAPHQIFVGISLPAVYNNGGFRIKT